MMESDARRSESSRVRDGVRSSRTQAEEPRSHSDRRRHRRSVERRNINPANPARIPVHGPPTRGNDRSARRRYGPGFWAGVVASGRLVRRRPPRLTGVRRRASPAGPPRSPPRCRDAGWSHPSVLRHRAALPGWHQTRTAQPPRRRYRRTSRRRRHRRTCRQAADRADAPQADTLQRASALAPAQSSGRCHRPAGGAARIRIAEAPVSRRRDTICGQARPARWSPRDKQHRAVADEEIKAVGSGQPMGDSEGVDPVVAPTGDPDPIDPGPAIGYSR